MTQEGANRRIRRLGPVVASLAVATMAVAACSSSGSKATSSAPAAGSSAAAPAGSSAPAASGKKVKVALITKDSSNPFFVAMQAGAKKAAAANNVDISIGAGAKDGDEQGQITLIENAIAAGDKGILITPNGPAVNQAITKARKAGLFVIALDTPTDPPSIVDITFATDNFKAGELIGKWAAAQFKGKDVTIAMLDLFSDKVVSVDYNRDQGFLQGMGIPLNDKKKNGDEAKTGKYKDGTYTIVCNEAGQGSADGGRSAMERCLTKNPDINLVYTINEPTAVGADAALKAVGKTATIVSIDGGCAGVASVKSGVIGATAQQYPLKMAQLGIEAVTTIAGGGAKPATSPGLEFFDTGVALVTDKPATGVESITSDAASKICWG